GHRGAKVLGIISLVDRRPAEPQPRRSGINSVPPAPTNVGDYFGEKGNQIFGIQYNSIIQVNPPIYQPNDCPLCKQGIPTEKPGSRGLK
ncbi:MAG: hypothetical protein AAB038_05670, partial [Planctomycetota bacterium]